MPTTPFIIFGDAPAQATGLSRIAGDLAARLRLEQGTLGLDVRSVGYVNWTGLPKHGVPVGGGWAFSDLTHWGVEALTAAYRHWFGDRKGIVLSVWDPGRCVPLTTMDLPVKLWGYFAVDADNIHGALSGPVLSVLSQYDRVLAYGPYGSQVLSRTLGNLPVDWLPHGIDTTVFRSQLTTDEYQHARATLSARCTDQHVLVGCVCTNHRRKDLGLWAQAIKGLADVGVNVYAWLHVNELVSDAWSVPQLAEDCQIEDRLTVTTKLSDRELACLYSLCMATLAPGRGEGFCYPIAESIACGCPVVHVDYAGGADITPTQWRVPPACFHVEGPYALRRPILAVEDVVERLLGIIRRRQVGELKADDVRALQHLDWTDMWPNWREWITRGL